MPSGKYLEKEIDAETGYKPIVWRCNSVRIVIEEVGVTVYLGLLGWKDVAACMAGKRHDDAKTVVLEHAEALPAYQQVFSAFLGEIVKDPMFVDAELKDLPS